jgi:hypothetical protein
VTTAPRQCARLSRAVPRRRAHGHPHARHERHPSHQTHHSGRAQPPARTHPHHLRPRRIGLRHAAHRRQRLPAQRRHRRTTHRRRASHRRRRRSSARPSDHPPPHHRVRPATPKTQAPASTALAALAARENQVLRLVAEGLSNFGDRSPASSSPRKPSRLTSAAYSPSWGCAIAARQSSPPNESGLITPQRKGPG